MSALRSLHPGKQQHVVFVPERGRSDVEESMRRTGQRERERERGGVGGVGGLGGAPSSQGNQK